MGLKVKCRKCRRGYQVKSSLAGRRFRCRDCEAWIEVPDADDEDLVELADIEVVDDLEDADPPARSSRRRPASGSQNSKRSRKQAQAMSKWLAVGMLVGVPCFFLVLIFVTISMRMQRPNVVPVAVAPSVPAVPLGSTPPVPASFGAVSSLPAVPFEIAAPAPPATKIDNIDLATLEEDELLGLAEEFVSQRDYQKAVLCQAAAVTKSNDGQYNLACYYSQSGNVDAAFYWLQVAGREEGVDSEWASEDADLARVRGDRRWRTLLPYLQQCGRYWESSGVSEHALILPAGYSPDRPVPVLIGLHGMGSSAHGFVSRDFFQQFADANQIAVLGVSGTRATGKKSFVWSEEPERDFARIDSALKQFFGKLTVQPGQMILFGFSQGGLMSAEIAARHPEQFCGAIIMSPGGISGVKIQQVAASGNHSRQGFVVVCGAGEHPGNVRFTNQYASSLRSLRARVFSKLYAEQNAHTLPPNFAERLGPWCQFILNPQTPAPTF